MVDDGSKRVGRPSSPPKEGALPPLDFMAVASPALQVGSLTGASGLLFGAISGVLRSTTPTLFALASGIQWFTLGSTFWATRTLLLRELHSDTNESARKISASALAGSVSGGIGGLLRSRKNIIPGSLIFASLGALGQAVYNYADSREGPKETEKGKEGGWMAGKWSPVKTLSDEEYGGILEERLLRVNAEIALLDESIEEVGRAKVAAAAAAKGGVKTEAKVEEVKK
ncbi:hypothetical protein V494_06103 [Pseudogymnoascus sp. VKM F-4513 (FW-928)]|nr:hypothetical protein V494_06103 [Pseudogymnoascus sp. VKM F-4513 (FW-928)]